MNTVGGSSLDIEDIFPDIQLLFDIDFNVEDALVVRFYFYIL